MLSPTHILYVYTHIHPFTHRPTHKGVCIFHTATKHAINPCSSSNEGEGHLILTSAVEISSSLTEKLKVYFHPSVSISYSDKLSHLLSHFGNWKNHPLETKINQNKKCLLLQISSCHGKEIILHC